MIWYYWTTMPERRASRMAVGRNVLADAGFRCDRPLSAAQSATVSPAHTGGSGDSTQSR